MVFLLLVYGIAGVVRAVAQKQYGIPFIFWILNTIFGIVIVVVPGLKLMTDGMLILKKCSEGKNFAYKILQFTFEPYYAILS